MSGWSKWLGVVLMVSVMSVPTPSPTSTRATHTHISHTSLDVDLFMMLSKTERVIHAVKAHVYNSLLTHVDVLWTRSGIRESRLWLFDRIPSIERFSPSKHHAVSTRNGLAWTANSCSGIEIRNVSGVLPHMR